MKNSSSRTQMQVFIPILLVLIFTLIPIFAGAATTLDTGNSNTTHLDTGEDSTTLKNPLGTDSICGLVNLLLKAAIAIGIPIAVLFIVYAGLKFVLARGNPGQLEEARTNLVYTLIGIAIFIGASLIAEVLINTLSQLGVTGIAACQI